MSAAFKRYTESFLHCLMLYQFIEESLRFCLVRCHATIKFRLEGYLTYESPLQAIEDAALGRLIDWYNPFTTNKDLIRDLRHIKTVRDHVAHQGLVFTLEEQLNEKLLEQKSEELEVAKAEAEHCFKLVTQEMNATDEMVNRAYAVLRAENEARNGELPPPFEDPLT